MMGSETARCAVMTWVGAGGDAVAPIQTALTLLPRKPGKNSIEWDQIEIDAVTKYDLLSYCSSSTIPNHIYNYLYKSAFCRFV